MLVRPSFACEKRLPVIRASAHRRDLHDTFHAELLARVEQGNWRAGLNRVEARRTAFANDADRVDHGVDALESVTPDTWFEIVSEWLRRRRFASTYGEDDR